MTADSEHEPALHTQFLVLFQPELEDDLRTARALQDAPQTQALSFAQLERLSEQLDSLGRQTAVAVITPGVAHAEHAAQRLLRKKNDLQVILLIAPGDTRSLGERFRNIPIRARQLEQLPRDAPNLIDDIVKIGDSLQQRRLYRQQILQADHQLGKLRPWRLDLTSDSIRRQLLEALPLGVVAATADGFVAETNAAARRLLQADVVDQSQPVRLSELIPVWSQLPVEALPTEEIITLNRSGQTSHLHLRTSHFAGNGTPRAVLIVIEDVTQQEQARQVLAATKAELEYRLLKDNHALFEAERERDSIKHFIAAFAHDLRTPVAAAMLSSQLLQRQYQRGETTSSLHTPVLLERVSRNLDRLKWMVEDLLDLTRHDMGGRLAIAPLPIRLDILLRETLDDLASLYDKQILIQEPLPVVEGCWDAGGMRRVIENLGSNAIKYGDPDDPADVALKVEREHVTLLFRNHGLPIPLEVQKMIFEPFYRAGGPGRQHIPGWGVGLAFVRVMVELHGGSVTIASSNQRETVFSVQLPKTCSPSQ